MLHDLGEGVLVKAPGHQQDAWLEQVDSTGKLCPVVPCVCANSYLLRLHITVKMKNWMRHWGLKVLARFSEVV